jgi:hypothetical protein
LAGADDASASGAEAGAESAAEDGAGGADGSAGKIGTEGADGAGGKGTSGSGQDGAVDAGNEGADGAGAGADSEGSGSDKQGGAFADSTASDGLAGTDDAGAEEGAESATEDGADGEGTSGSGQDGASAAGNEGEDGATSGASAGAESDGSGSDKQGGAFADGTASDGLAGTDDAGAEAVADSAAEDRVGNSDGSAGADGAGPGGSSQDGASATGNEGSDVASSGAGTGVEGDGSGSDKEHGAAGNIAGADGVVAASAQADGKDTQAKPKNQDALANAKTLLSAEKKVKSLTGFSGQGGGLTSGLVSGDQTGSSYPLSNDAGSFEAFEAQPGHAPSQSAEAGAVSANSDSKGGRDGTQGSDRASEFNSAISDDSTSLMPESPADLHTKQQGVNTSDKVQQSPVSNQESEGVLQEHSLEQFQDLKSNDKTRVGADQPNPTAMPNGTKDSVSIGQDNSGQIKGKTSFSQGHADKKNSLPASDELIASSFDPKNRGMPVMTPGTMSPTALSDPSPLLADWSSASALPTTPVMEGDRPALPQSDLKAIPSAESGAAKGSIECPTSATPFEPDHATETASIDANLWARLVAWYVSTFKR